MLNCWRLVVQRGPFVATTWSAFWLYWAQRANKSRTSQTATPFLWICESDQKMHVFEEVRRSIKKRFFASKKAMTIIATRKSNISAELSYKLRLETRFHQCLRSVFCVLDRFWVALGALLISTWGPKSSKNVSVGTFSASWGVQEPVYSISKLTSNRRPFLIDVKTQKRRTYTLLRIK